MGFSGVNYEHFVNMARIFMNIHEHWRFVQFSYLQYTRLRTHSRRGFLSVIGSVHDDLFARMFTNVHEIVHDSFLSFVNSMNAVRALDHDVFEFCVSGIFVNNWAI